MFQILNSLLLHISSLLYSFQKLLPCIQKLVEEGALTEDQLLDNVQKVLNLVREANVTLRWLMLHTAPLSPGISLLYTLHAWGYLYFIMFFYSIRREQKMQTSKGSNYLRDKILSLRRFPVVVKCCSI